MLLSLSLFLSFFPARPLFSWSDRPIQVNLSTKATVTFCAERDSERPFLITAPCTARQCHLKQREWEKSTRPKCHSCSFSSPRSLERSRWISLLICRVLRFVWAQSGSPRQSIRRNTRRRQAAGVKDSNKNLSQKRGEGKNYRWLTPLGFHCVWRPLTPRLMRAAFVRSINECRGMDRLIKPNSAITVWRPTVITWPLKRGWGEIIRGPEWRRRLKAATSWKTDFFSCYFECGK